MIAYFISFVLCSAVLLGAYLLLLQNQAMYRFNRAYLLASLIFSLGIPLVVINKPLPAIQSIATTTTAAPVEEINIPITIEAENIQALTTQQPVNYFNYGLAAYLLIAGTLLYRFVSNLLALRKVIRGSKSIPYHNARLVLIAQSATPHTFLSNIFINEADYEAGNIDRSILQHELAHVRQRHSLDVILIELLQVFCWLNPILFLYRRAIQLNHEFLADEAVLTASKDIRQYQYLLLNQLGLNKSMPVTSQFNYSITKQRLLMMTKTTSAATGRFAKLAALLVAALAFVLFSNKTEAFQQTATANKGKATRQDTTKTTKNRFWDKRYPHTEEGVSQQMLEEYKAIISKYEDTLKTNGTAWATITLADKARMEEIFKQMNPAQQSAQKIGFRTSSPKRAKVVPTAAQLSQWQNSKKYGLWIDYKRVKNSVLNNYKPNDFNLVFVSKLAPNAINYKNHKYQVDLMTASKYQEYINRPRPATVMYHLYRPSKNKTVYEVK